MLWARLQGPGEHGAVRGGLWGARNAVDELRLMSGLRWGVGGSVHCCAQVALEDRECLRFSVALEVSLLDTQPQLRWVVTAGLACAKVVEPLVTGSVFFVADCVFFCWAGGR